MNKPTNLIINVHSFVVFESWSVYLSYLFPFVLEMGQQGSSKCPKLGQQVHLQTQSEKGSKNRYVNQYWWSRWTSKIIRGHVYWCCIKKSLWNVVSNAVFINVEYLCVRKPLRTTCAYGMFHILQKLSYTVTHLHPLTISRVKQVMYRLFLCFRVGNCLSVGKLLVIGVIYRKFKVRISDF